MDIDLLAQRIPNDAEKMKKVFNDIFSIECDDALRFDLNTLEVTNITEFKEYHGVNVSITGYLDRTKVPVSIDIGCIAVLVVVWLFEFGNLTIQHKNKNCYFNLKKIVV